MYPLFLSCLTYSFFLQGEIFKETKERLQKRTGLKGKPFEKIKFAVVRRAPYSKPVYLEDGNLTPLSVCLIRVDADFFPRR